MNLLRRRSWMLLWLLLALLPLRGWAGGAMHLPAAPVDESTMRVAPCHGDGHAAPVVGDASTTDAKTCALCDLCHAAALPAVSIATRAQRLAQGLPPTTPRAAPAATPDALFRPPRR